MNNLYSAEQARNTFANNSSKFMEDSLLTILNQIQLAACNNKNYITIISYGFNSIELKNKDVSQWPTINNYIYNKLKHLGYELKLILYCGEFEDSISLKISW